MYYLTHEYTILFSEVKQMRKKLNVVLRIVKIKKHVSFFDFD